MLPNILSGEICHHFRVFNSTVFYQYCQTESSVHSAEICMKCHMRVKPDMAERVVIVANFNDEKCTKTHNMCIFFENNRIPFSSFDPCNSHLEIHDRSRDFFAKHNIPAQPINTPRFWINDRELTLGELIELAKKNLIHSIINRRRCPSCYTLKGQVHRSQLTCELCRK